MRRRSIVVVAALAALVAVFPTGTAAKKKKIKNSFVATINGKRVKFTKNISFTGGGGTVDFLALGQTPVRVGRFFKTLGFGCADFFPPATFPSPPTACTSNYQETKVGSHPVTRFWAQTTIDTQVVYESYTDGIVVGHWSAVIPNTSPGDLPPVTVEGQFRGRFTGTGH